ncbi:MULTISPECIES: LPXTG cell wall anchor domain-containing protein [Brevibacillus]|nr:LPXTG cell wall anchor domain-containing protein [Brevibacillus sp.]
MLPQTGEEAPTGYLLAGISSLLIGLSILLYRRKSAV